MSGSVRQRRMRCSLAGLGRGPGLLPPRIKEGIRVTGKEPAATPRFSSSSRSVREAISLGPVLQ